MKKIAVLLSGSGTNFQAIIDAQQAGTLNATIELCVASNPRAYGIERAKAANIPVLIFTPENYQASPEAVDAKIAAAAAGCDYLIMAGYMRKVTPVLLNAFPNRVVNLHPALLPKHPGAHGIADAFNAHDEETGITIHFANEEYDEGPIIFQAATPILPTDTLETLEARIHQLEHEHYPKVIAQLP